MVGEGAGGTFEAVFDRVGVDSADRDVRVADANTEIAPGVAQAHTRGIVVGVHGHVADPVAPVVVRVVGLALDEVAKDSVMRRRAEVVRDLLVYGQVAVGPELHPALVVGDVLTGRLCRRA